MTGLIKNEMLREKVDDIFRTQPDNYISALEKISFTYYDDHDPGIHDVIVKSQISTAKDKSSPIA